MTDTSLVRVTIHIPGGNTPISSRVLSVTCPRTMLEIWALRTLRSRFSDLREVGFRVIPVHPAVTWNAPILPLNKEKMVLIYEDVVLQLDAVVLLKLHLPPFYGEGAIYCPRRLRKKDLVAQLGLQIPCHRTGSECVCYVNSIELTNGADAEVEDGDVIWCFRASPDMGHEIETLSVGSPSLMPLRQKGLPPFMPEFALNWRFCQDGLDLETTADDHKTTHLGEVFAPIL